MQSDNQSIADKFHAALKEGARKQCTMQCQSDPPPGPVVREKVKTETIAVIQYVPANALHQSAPEKPMRGIPSPA